MRRFLALVFVVFPLCCLAQAWTGSGGGGWIVVGEAARDGCHLKVMLNRAEVSVAGEISVRVEADAPEAFRIALDRFSGKPGGFTLLGQKLRAPYLSGDNRIVAGLDCRLEPFLAGYYSIPPVKAVFTREVAPQGAGSPEETVELQTGEIPVGVRSVLGDGSAAPPGILGAPLDLPESRFAKAVTIGAVALLAAGVAALWLVVRRRRKAIPPAPPGKEEAFRRRLQSILDSGLVEKNELAPFFSTLSAAAGAYAGELSDEGGPVPGGCGREIERELLQELLGLCELVRFARYEPSEEEVRHAVACCSALVAGCGELP